MELDPKLIAISTCGKYVYPIDSITGVKTFAPIDYFKKNLETKYGGDLKRFIKEYITRDTKKYLKEGYSIEDIKAIAAASKGGRLPKLNFKPKEHPDAPPKVKKQRLSQLADTTKTVTHEDGKVETIRTYPWSNDPQNYFRSAPKTVDIAEATKDTCLRPDYYLDELCLECPFYSECCCPLKEVSKK